jgi:hypothetical protein
VGGGNSEEKEEETKVGPFSLFKGARDSGQANPIPHVCTLRESQQGLRRYFI